MPQNWEIQQKFEQTETMSLSAASKLLGISPNVMSKGLRGGTIPDLKLSTIAELQQRPILTSLKINGQNLPVLRPGLAIDYKSPQTDGRKFSGWNIDGKDDDILAGLDRWWAPASSQSVIAAGGFVVTVGSIICALIKLNSRSIEKFDDRVKYDGELVGLIQRDGDMTVIEDNPWVGLAEEIIGSRVLSQAPGHFGTI